MSNIYLLSTCDEWKSSSSMSCIMATTSLDKLRKGIIQKIIIKMKDLVFFIIFPNYSLIAYFLAYNTTMTEKLKRFK